MNDRNLSGVESLGEVGENTGDERHAAALAVCRAATDRTDAAELLAMLGLTDVRPTRIADKCRKCLRPMSNLALLGHARRASKGMCTSCYQRTRREPVAGRQAVVAVVDITTPLGVVAQGAELSATPSGDSWLLHFPGSRRTVTVAADAVRPAKAASA
ncbi:hypothetical protein [Nocardia sp. NPDC055049]